MFTLWAYIFERLWAVDRLQRLGISSRRLQNFWITSIGIFKINLCSQITVHEKFSAMTKLKFRSWTEQGVFSASNSTIHDVDDTAMGFRLLRLHGYQVSAGKFSTWLLKSPFFSMF